MSSASWIYNTRRLNFPLPQKIQALIAQFNAKVTDDITDEGGEELQTRSEGGIGRSYIKFCDADLTRLDDSLTSTVLTTIQSCPAFEPDFDQCKLLVEFDNTGGTVLDYSGFRHHAHVHGVSRMWWGIRYGYGPLSLETIFDGRTNYAEIDDHSDLSFDNTDFTFMFRILPFDLSMSTFHKQVVICKKDPSGPDIWFAFELDVDGSATFNLSLSSVSKYSITVPADTFVAVAYADVTPTTPRYDVVITFAFITRELVVYINNVAYTTVVNTIPSTSNIIDYVGYDLQIGRYTNLVGSPVTLPELTEDNIDPIRVFSKLYFGTFQQLKFWKGKALTATEVSHHYTNKLTISDVPFGEVAIPNGSMVLIS